MPPSPCFYRAIACAACLPRAACGIYGTMLAASGTAPEKGDTLGAVLSFSADDIDFIGNHKGGVWRPQAPKNLLLVGPWWRICRHHGPTGEVRRGFAPPALLCPIKS